MRMEKILINRKREGSQLCVGGYSLGIILIRAQTHREYTLCYPCLH